jgi:hypothetical protein
MGSLAVSSAHQHAPAGSQLNSVPQEEQASRRAGGFSNRFVMTSTEPSPCFHVGRRYDPPASYARDPAREIRWPAIRKPPLSPSIVWPWRARARAGGNRVPRQRRRPSRCRGWWGEFSYAVILRSRASRGVSKDGPHPVQPSFEARRRGRAPQDDVLPVIPSSRRFPRSLPRSASSRSP